MDTESQSKGTSGHGLQAPHPEGIPGKIFLNDEGLRGGWRLLIYGFFVAGMGFVCLFVLALILPMIKLLDGLSR